MENGHEIRMYSKLLKLQKTFEVYILSTINMKRYWQRKDNSLFTNKDMVIVFDEHEHHCRSIICGHLQVETTTKRNSLYIGIKWLLCWAMEAEDEWWWVVMV